MTEAPLARCHHLTVIGADRIVVVQRQRDRSVGQHPAYKLERLDTDQQHVVEMYDVRAEREQQTLKLGNDPVEVRL